jgi:hypothetical protein
LAAQYAMHRGMWSPSLPAESGLATSLEFYRREIERRAVPSRGAFWAGRSDPWFLPSPCLSYRSFGKE